MVDNKIQIKYVLSCLFCNLGFTFAKCVRFIKSQKYKIESYILLEWMEACEVFFRLGT